MFVPRILILRYISLCFFGEGAQINQNIQNKVVSTAPKGTLFNKSFYVYNKTLEK
jgi:hypothetical protein